MRHRLFALSLLLFPLVAVIAAPAPAMAQNTCTWAYDGECDELQYGGTGACPDFTDTYDCAGPLPMADNSCQWAFDGECDELQYGGTGACPNDTDTDDCAFAFGGGGGGGGYDAPGFADDSCTWAYDGVCDEAQYGGTGACPNNTDTFDCYN